MILIAIAGLVALAMVAALLLVVLKAANNAPDLPVTAQWIDELSPERYRPMMRLLDDRDIELLRSQPGFTPKMAAKMREQRARIFGGYLDTLNADFQRVCTAVRILMAHSHHDRPDLATVLIRQQAAFMVGMAYARAQMWLFRLGFGGMEANALVNCFDVMRRELRSLVPAEFGAAA